MDEWERRNRRMDAALRAEHVAADERHPIERRRALARAAGEVHAAKAEMWPRLSQDSPYAAIREAVLAELAAPRYCPACEGHGAIMEGEHLRDCTACGGSGDRPASSRARAARIGRHKSTYHLMWDAPYTWLLAQCLARRRNAERELADHAGLA